MQHLYGHFDCCLTLIKKPHQFLYRTQDYCHIQAASPLVAARLLQNRYQIQILLPNVPGNFDTLPLNNGDFESVGHAA